MTYRQVANYVLKGYGKDSQSALADQSVAMFRKTEYMNHDAYGNELCAMKFRCTSVYDEMRVKGVFVEGLMTTA